MKKQIQLVVPSHVTHQTVKRAMVPALSALEGIANLIGGAIDPEILPLIQDYVNKTTKIAGAIQDNVKQKVKAYVVKHGQALGENGSLQTMIGGFRMALHRTGGGYDEAKVKALILGKPKFVQGKKVERDLESFCQAEVTYRVDYDKVQQLIGKNILTQEELEECRGVHGYSVQSPVRVVEGGEFDE